MEAEQSIWNDYENKKMKVVIDTNGFLASVPLKGKNKWLYHAFMEEKFIWVFCLLLQTNICPANANWRAFFIAFHVERLAGYLAAKRTAPSSRIVVPFK